MRLGKHGILTDESFGNVDCFGRAVDNVASVGARESNFIVNNAPPFFAGEYLKFTCSKFASLCSRCNDFILQLYLCNFLALAILQLMFGVADCDLQYASWVRGSESPAL